MLLSEAHIHEHLFIFLSVCWLSLTLTALFPSPETKSFPTALSLLVRVTQHVTEIQSKDVGQARVYDLLTKVKFLLETQMFAESWGKFLLEDTFDHEVHIFIRLGTNHSLWISSLPWTRLPFDAGSFNMPLY